MERGRFDANRTQVPTGDHYTTLGIPQSATRGEIRWAYLRRLKQISPGTTESVEGAEQIHLAYEVLLDESRRNSYDEYLANPQSSKSSDFSSTAPSRGSAARPPPPVDTETTSSEHIAVGPTQPHGLPMAAYVTLFVVMLVGGLGIWGYTQLRPTSANTGQSSASPNVAVTGQTLGWTSPPILQGGGVPGDNEASVVDASVVGGHLYYTLNLPHNGGVILMSVNAATGRQEWRYQGAGQNPADAVAPVPVGTLVIGHDDASVFALDARSGQVRWQQSQPGGSMRSPIIANGLVILRDNPPDSISAYRADTGAQVWTRNMGGDVFNQVRHVSWSGDQLLILRYYSLESWAIKNGHDQWSITLKDSRSEDDHGDAIGGSASGLVIISRFQSIEARRLSNGSRVWRVDVPSPGYPQDLMVSSQAAIVTTCAAGYTCANDSPPVRTAYDPQTGQQLWQEPTAGANGSIEPTRVHVVWLDKTTLLQWQAYPSRVWLVDVRTHSVIWDESFAQIQPASVAADQRLIYVIDLSGGVLAIAR